MGMCLVPVLTPVRFEAFQLLHVRSSHQFPPILRHRRICVCVCECDKLQLSCSSVAAKLQQQ